MTEKPYFTEEEFQQLLENGKRSATGEQIDPPPVVKLFTPDGSFTWLLTEINPSFHHMAFGLATDGYHEPEYGIIDLSEVRKIRGPAGLAVEKDKYFRAKGPISEYAMGDAASYRKW